MYMKNTWKSASNQPNKTPYQHEPQPNPEIPILHPKLKAIYCLLCDPHSMSDGPERERNDSDSSSQEDKQPLIVLCSRLLPYALENVQVG